MSERDKLCLYEVAFSVVLKAADREGADATVSRLRGLLEGDRSVARRVFRSPPRLVSTDHFEPGHGPREETG